MELKTSLKPLYLKLAIFTSVFLLLLVFYIFSLRFYSQRITKRVENIQALKEEIVKSQKEKEEELKLQQLVNLIQTKTGKELSAILFEVENKLNRDFETTKNMLLDKFSKENWKAISSNFNLEEQRLSFKLQFPQGDIEKFLDFLIEETLILKIENFNLNKSAENFYDLDISFKLK